ncbi:MAG: polynucleotide adenylyltransferase PcnB [Acidobacteria bacterium]|nr:MAG: polynucleotide adenylyltransferase PcnB [Acidobacteriota bacterium]
MPPDCLRVEHQLMEPRIIPRSQHPISRRQIDPDALKVLYRLHRHGRIAYLVGGSVRDLLLGGTPKDFDIVTDAHPGEVKKLFRNSWIVGRRFRLVHVVFGRERKVVEVATFRAKSEIEPPADPGRDARSPAAVAAHPGTKKVPARTGGGLLVTWENTFGTPEEDARRRDLSINGLFYDIDTFAIIDYVGGLKDIEKRLVRAIGDADIRFQEDPVRMMRAIKFSARLDLRIEKETRAALFRQAAGISLSAAPRVMEEIYRLLESGCAETSFRLLHETGLLLHLIPEIMPLADHQQGFFWPNLRELDRMVKAGVEEVTRAVEMAVLLDGLVRPLLTSSSTGGEGIGERVHEIIKPIAMRLRMTRADTAKVIQMLIAQRHLLRPHGRRFSMAGFVRRGYFPGAYQILRIHAAVTGKHEEVLKKWEERIKAVREGGESGQEGQVVATGRKRRRRRRRRPTS